MLKGKKIAVVGLGKIGEALVTGLLATGKLQKGSIVGTTAHAESAARASERLGIRVGTDTRAFVEGCDVVVIATKPATVRKVLPDVAAGLGPKALVVSVAASVTTAAIEEGLGRPAPVIRVMPNTPCLIGKGMSALSAGKQAGPKELALAGEIFQSVGRTVILDETLMDAVTGLSGSGPAYIYMVIESLAEGGVKCGIPRDVSTLLAAQTMLGASQMVLDLGSHPALLKDAVTTPAGCTIDGIMKLEEGGLRVTLIKAVVEATRRAKELASQ